MAKVKIIDSYSLECLKNNILSDIREADAQISIYADELEGENRNRQNEKTIRDLNNFKVEWVVKRNTWHQCLCKILNSSKEIEI